jgi:hypothetical protein
MLHATGFGGLLSMRSSTAHWYHTSCMTTFGPNSVIFL